MSGLLSGIDHVVTGFLFVIELDARQLNCLADTDLILSIQIRADRECTEVRELPRQIRECRSGGLRPA